MIILRVVALVVFHHHHNHAGPGIGALTKKQS